ncbi:hypothetical protein G9A89_008268 [Geosiphon pyriformis]|nr:hypothetical protein G9A89_008268 [Geosiphon pyriformis]
MVPKNSLIEEENGSQGESSSGSPSSSSSSNKRPRLDEDEADESDATLVSPTFSKRLVKGKGKGKESDYLEGSIVRVQLKNFVTYDAVEFRPGPNLNMIIGPNGTGKSTIVCAIALGLGWNTTLLGRAKEISDFVKHGATNAEIEIELKCQNKNIIINRKIKKEKNSSSWQINRQSATHREVLARIHALNIQVDNLCQFLPQDKVSEFAQMTPPELLVQTQKAVGEQEMLEHHKKLIRLREEEKALLLSTKGDRDQVDNLEKRNTVLERDVMRYRQREAILKKVRLYEMRVPFARYGMAKSTYDEAKHARQNAHLEYRGVMEENEPVRNRKYELEESEKEAVEEKKHAVDEFTKTRGITERYAGKLEEMESKSDDVRTQLRLIKKEEKQRKVRLVRLQEEIQELEGLVNEAPSAINTKETQQKIEGTDRRMRNLRSEIGDIQVKQEDLAEERKNVAGQREGASRDLRKFDDVKERRLAAIQVKDPETFQAYRWIQSNKNLFQKEVFLPWLEINIKDKRYIDIVEASLGFHAIRTFVCQTKEDYHTLTRTLCDEKKFRINAACFDHKKMSDFIPPMDHQQLNRFGFQSYVLDQIEGPEPVLIYICQNNMSHRIPVATKDPDHKQIEQSRIFNNYFVGDTSFQIKWSRYGRQLAQTTTSRINPAHQLVDTVDFEKKRQLERQLLSLEEKLNQYEVALNDLSQRETDIRNEFEDIRAEREQYVQEKREAQAALKKYERNKVALETRKRNLHEELQRPNPIPEKENVLRQEFRKTARRREKLFMEFKESFGEFLQALATRNVASLKHMQITSEIHALIRETQEKDDALKEAKRKYNEADRRFNEAKENAKRLLHIANEGIKNIDEATKAEFQELTQGMTLEQLEDAITSERTKAELQYATNPQVIDQYNERLAEIDKLKVKLAAKDDRLAKLATEMTATRILWEPKLNNLVTQISSQFSDSFDRIGCAGEVRVSSHEDYDKWGIDILVKFRDRETLQALTAQRQSGGERSVSTIMYLMSLQELAKAPFRVVDEINQGMDPRNERLVHSQMVQTACRPNTSQYFLITPKLLPDLDYHERMKILCINNGEWQPEKLDVQKYLNNRTKTKNGR